MVEAARSMLQTPFVWGGRHPKAGVDCGGLVKLAANMIGIQAEDAKIYPRQAWSRRLRSHLEDHYVKIEFEQIQAASILAFFFEKTRKGEKVLRHLGIYTGKGTFIHCWDHFKMVKETTLTVQWIQRIDSCYDYTWQPSS